MTVESPKNPSPWHITQRLAALRGEERANVLRVVGIAVFYSIEVLNYHGLALGPIQIPRAAGVDTAFHAGATAIAVGWMCIAAAVLIALKNQVFPAAFSYVSAALDLVLMTCVLLLADGPRSPVLLVLFLVVVLAGLRLSTRLVAFTAVGAVLGYLFLLGDVALRRPALAVPIHWQITTIAALLLCGAVLFATLREVERAVVAYAALENASGAGEES